MPTPTDKKVITYIKTFNENEKKTHEIAKQQLETSFSMKKSIGFKSWTEKNNKK